MKNCPLCGGKLIGRIYLMMDKAGGKISEDNTQKRVEDVCQDCGAYITKYNYGIPTLFSPTVGGPDKFVGVLARF